MFMFIAAAAFFFVASDAVINPQCQQKMDMGDVICANRTTTRFFMDNTLKTCFQFKYSGCGGNSNNFATEVECYNNCFTDHMTGCRYGGEPFGLCTHKKVAEKSNYFDYECKRDDQYCQTRFAKPVCCSRHKMMAMRNEAAKLCGTFSVNRDRIGKTCKSLACNGTCVENKNIAACC